MPVMAIMQKSEKPYKFGYTTVYELRTQTLHKCYRFDLVVKCLRNALGKAPATSLSKHCFASHQVCFVLCINIRFSDFHCNLPSLNGYIFDCALIRVSILFSCRLCHIIALSQSARRCPGYSFNQLPLKNPNLLKKWLAKIRRVNIPINKNSRVCSGHKQCAVVISGMEREVES